MRSPNWFLTSERFVSLATWKDLAGPFALWLSVLVETQVDLGPDTTSTRWTLALGRRRWQIDVARWSPRSLDGKIDWSADPDGLEDMLRWSKRVFRRSWTKSDLEKLFASRPEWRRLLVQSGARHHYIRIMLARDLMEQENGQDDESVLQRPFASSGDHLAAALRMPKTDDKHDAEWTNANMDARHPRVLRPLGTVEGQAPMEQLDHLANVLDLPQEVRDLGNERKLSAETTALDHPPRSAAPFASFPSYLPPASPGSQEAARLLTERLQHDDHVSSSSAAKVPVLSSSSTSLSDFLPPSPASQAEAARLLEEALRRFDSDNSGSSRPGE